MGDETPADVREAILLAEQALHKIRGFLPSNVGFPLLSAHGKLRVALVVPKDYSNRAGPSKQ